MSQSEITNLHSDTTLLRTLSLSVRSKYISVVNLGHMPLLIGRTCLNKEVHGLLIDHASISLLIGWHGLLIEVHGLIIGWSLIQVMV